MKKFYFVLILFCQFLFSQNEKSIYKLDSLPSLLTKEVKDVVAKNIIDKNVVFLGEAVHHSGSDFLAKIDFVKYLVLHLGYRNIAFESDFFAFLFYNNKRNLYLHWSQSKECKSLFKFLEQNKVKMWGFDNKIHSSYSYQNFDKNLSNHLIKENIVLDGRFIELTKKIIVNQYKSGDLLSNNDIQYLKFIINDLQSKDIIVKDKIWSKIIESYKSAIELYTVKDNSSDDKRITIRDNQMAKNLSFIINNNPKEKFIVWLANGHMSKQRTKKMKGQTMGYQFRLLNPNSSYHIAFASLRLNGEKEKSILKRKRSKNNVLSLLPSVYENYFLDSNKLISINNSLKNKTFNDNYIFNLLDNKTKLLNHFDALVFIANGFETSYSLK